jgi:GT2 family glycosyltransferase
MTHRPAVVVAVPARDEAGAVEDCLAGLDRSIRHARHLDLIDDVVVIVSAHRCSDNTAAVALRTLVKLGVRGEVLVDDEADNVGTVRDRASRHGLALLRDPRETWVFSTDADTVVGPDWIVQVLAVAAQHDTACVVGLAALDAWHGSIAGLCAYRDLLDRKLHLGSPGNEHHHVYGANLAVRTDAYLAVGGFPDIAHGEDQQLVDSIDAAGYGVARTCQVTVTTSGRFRGRAGGGLADLLLRLQRDQTRAGAGLESHQRSAELTRGNGLT